jgi:hypothetical protein
MNPLHWPEIKHLPEYVYGKLEAYVNHCEGNPDPSEERRLRRLTKELLDQRLFEDQWVANVKYDGTNLGISNNQELFGRRQQVTSATYQHKDVTFLRQVNIQNVYDAIIPNYGSEVQIEIETIVIYLFIYLVSRTLQDSLFTGNS